jgi:hypothetical protein
MNALALTLRPIEHGWAVMLSDGRELARFNGWGARRRALRYLARLDLGRELRHVG